MCVCACVCVEGERVLTLRHTTQIRRCFFATVIGTNSQHTTGRHVSTDTQHDYFEQSTLKLSRASEVIPSISTSLLEGGRMKDSGSSWRHVDASCRGGPGADPGSGQPLNPPPPIWDTKFSPAGKFVTGVPDAPM